ncbi:HPr family phosphocarrier protein [Rubrobacter taiwanensis]|jgi:phosphotransferase system HPr (HPr) family protein|uniref:Phosphocarrier protein HPr n=1 Tax=Rubrobacter taiwanensis TaxID=185139 RepID=A0A4R1BQR1_9ACTN|nr:HPr family phosphocarrier protein [Rubrobacter taiwanensis]TCJ19951.1 HPr family phosphocarrier protein [Rubrobacter taiwanensis]
MVEREVVVGHEEGIHARPAAVFVKTAKQFASEIEVEKDGKTANAKSPLKLMTLAVKKDDRVKIRAEGPDARAAVEALAAIAAGELPEGE